MSPKLEECLQQILGTNSEISVHKSTVLKILNKTLLLSGSGHVNVLLSHHICITADV